MLAILQKMFHPYNISVIKINKQWNKNMEKIRKYIIECIFHRTIFIKISKLIHKIQNSIIINTIELFSTAEFF